MSAQASPSSTPPEARPRSRPVSLKQLTQADFGSLRVIITLAVIWLIFTIANDRFLTPINLTNLTLQIAATGMISIGVVLVLLLGEIDLSVGIVSGLAGAVMAVLTVKHGWSPVAAIAAGLAVGAAIGAFHGFIHTRFGVPSFVVTLAGLLGWQGALLWVLGDTGTINLRDPVIVALAGTFFTPALGWAVALAMIVFYAAVLIVTRRTRIRAGLEAPSSPTVARRVAAVAIPVLVTVWVLNQDRGLPLALVILVGFVIVFDVLTRRTRFGRNIYAIGGNEEAARRAGIAVNRVRTTVFALAGILAACGGMLAASRLLAVSQNSGGSDLLLLAIAGPVIAGTSLFGGRGTVWSALLGALVIGSISNGMDLTAVSSDVKFMVTGAVLLLAVIADALTSMRRTRTT